MPHLSKSDQQAKTSTTEARRRKEVALATRREIELAVMEGQLLRAADVEEHWAAAVVRIRQAVLAIPSKCASQFADPRQAERVIRQECETALRSIADDR